MSNLDLRSGAGGRVEAEGDNIAAQVDTALNDSDKTFTVPAGKTWKLSSLSASLITTGTAGNRQMRIEIGDGANVIWFKNFGQVQTASLTRTYFAAPDLVDDAAFNAGGQIRLWLLGYTLPAGYTIRIYDSAAIAATADDLSIWLIVDARTAGARI